MTKQLARGLSARALAAALYLMVAGGPYGLEELAAKVGFAGAAAVLVAVPVLWALPVALMAAELGALFPARAGATRFEDEGGCYVWVTRALGPFLGAQEAWLTLAASVFDMGIYPALFTAYLGAIFPPAAAHPVLVGAPFLIAGALINLRPVRGVGSFASLATGLLLAPFAILALALLVTGKLSFGALVQVREAPLGGRDFVGAALIALWNFMGWDNGAIIEVDGEGDRAAAVFPRALALALALVVGSYLAPLAVAAATGVDPSGWGTGAFAPFAARYGGAPFRVLFSLGGAVSAFGMYTSLVLSYGRLVRQVAETGFLPAALTARDAHGTPCRAVLACAAVWLVALGLPFTKLVTLDVVLYGGGLLLEFASLIVLRVRAPELARPFRVPGGLPVVAALGVPPALLLTLALLRGADERVFGAPALAVALGTAALGPLLYVVRRRPPSDGPGAAEKAGRDVAPAR